MRGRLNSTVWMIVILDAIAMIAVLLLAYSAGQHAGGVGITDAPSVTGSGAGGKLLVAFCLFAGAILVTFVVLNNKVLAPLKGLATFAERFAQGDYRARASV